MRWGLLCALALPLSGVAACAGRAAPDAPPPDELASAAPTDVRVQLVFDEQVDLDLYVTGPAQEAVYFANELSRDGGTLVADRRCDSPAPRIEVVTFPAAPPGPYRVGVDFMVRCAGDIDRAPYELVLERPGQAPAHQRGEARFGVFEPRAAEFQVGEGP